MATGSLPPNTFVGSADAELTEEMIEAAKAELRETDGEPLESPWHRANINLLIDALIWHRRGRTNYFVGGNMFIYYSKAQARNWDYKGPDFFVVNDIDGTRERRFWWVFEEEGRFPNMILELLSPSTAVGDRTTKKDLYEKRFQTPEYFCHDFDAPQLEGWRLRDSHYEPMRPGANGWLWSAELGLWLGAWEGAFQGCHKTWVRFYDSQGNLVLTEAEAQRQRGDQEKQRADQERQHADQEKQRADNLEAQVVRLQALLKDKGISPDQPG